MGSAPSAPSEERAATLISRVDAVCVEAAKKISEADVLLLCTGAGFSADSGLAVYADVAKVAAYSKRDLEYHDICQPRWLDAEPELFWGFWGQCFNDYRNTAPHAGYEIIDRWADWRFRSSPAAQRLRELQMAAKAAKDETAEDEPYVVEDHPGAFFAFTSNVDAHHFDWFRACEIRECHGNTEIYQEAGSSTGKVWRAPLDFSFNVDKETMLAPTGPPATSAVPEASPEPAATPAIGQVRGGGRPHMLRYMPGTPDEMKEVRFASNHPTTEEGYRARPAILMFGDYGWTDSECQAKRWQRWADAVKCLAGERVGQQLKVVILEFGAGGNVTTVRNTSESKLSSFTKAGAAVNLIRVNPAMPLGDGSEYQPGGEREDLVLSIMAGGLECIHKMQAAMPPEASVTPSA